MSSPALPPLFRPLRLLALAPLLVTFPALHASPITYQMTFKSGSYTGTGALTLASQPDRSGTLDFTEATGQLQNLTFTAFGQTYNLSNDHSASAQFVNGQLSAINFDYGQSYGQPAESYTVEFANGFSLYDSSDRNDALVSGSYTVNSASPTPEPASLVLFATALVGGAVLVLRRNRAAQS